jgi:hypothetical protein
MARRTVVLSTRHDSMLGALQKQLGTSMVETMQRALEALQEKEAKREKEIGQ